MATNFGQNWQNDLHSIRWRSDTVLNIAIPIYRLTAVNRNCDIEIHVYAILIKIGAVTPEITLKETVTFGTRRKKLACPTEYHSLQVLDRSARNIQLW